jgi:hypothetical protein
MAVKPGTIFKTHCKNGHARTPENLYGKRTCKPCALARNSDYYRKHKISYHKLSWGRNIRLKYGITVDQYNAFFLKQNGQCAICGVHQAELNQKLSVDHNHATKKVRGLLCVNCNRSLGIIENKTFCMKASIYLAGGI